MTPDDAPVLVGFVLLVLWLGALTAGLARTRRHLGEPVYRRLPNGRIRFEWSVGTAYQQARRAHDERHARRIGSDEGPSRRNPR